MISLSRVAYFSRQLYKTLSRFFPFFYPFPPFAFRRRRQEKVKRTHTSFTRRRESLPRPSFSRLSSEKRKWTGGKKFLLFCLLVGWKIMKKESNTLDYFNQKKLIVKAHTHTKRFDLRIIIIIIKKKAPEKDFRRNFFKKTLFFLKMAPKKIREGKQLTRKKKQSVQYGHQMKLV